MDIKQIEYFRVVGRLEHVTKAAIALGIPQPALSRSLARLQRDLGVTLFEKLGRSVRLTAAGSVFLRHAERMLRELRDAQLAMADVVRGDTSVVTLGFLRSLASDVPKLVGTFCALHRDAHFVFREVRASEWEDRLAAGEIDMCLAMAPLRRPGISWKATLTQQLCLSVPSAHPLANRASVSLRKLAGEEFVSYRAGHGTRSMLDQLCGSAGFSPRIAYEGDDTTCLLAFIAAGFGASVLPRHPKWPGVVDIRITDPGAQRNLGLAWMSDHYLSFIAQKFRAYVLAKGSHDSVISRP